MGTRVSIVIVAYRQEAFIEEAVRSALAQDHPDVEVIVADDASPDATVERLVPLVREHSDRLRVVRGEENAGITANHNRGLRAARGEFVALQGGDDVLLPGKVSAQVAWFREQPRRVLCGHPVEIFESATGAVLSERGWPYPVMGGVGAEAIVRHGVPFGGTAAMLRRDALPAHGLDERLPVAADWWLYIETVGLAGEWGSVPASLARYRRHGAGVTQVGAVRSLLQQLAAEDCFLTLALAEARFPAFAAAVRNSRARLAYGEMRYALRTGDLAHARAFARSVPWSEARWAARVAALRGLMLLPGKAERVVRWQDRNAW